MLWSSCTPDALVTWHDAAHLSLGDRINEKSKINNNLIPPLSSKGPTSASININNYYTDNIYNAIYNNLMPHHIYNKNTNAKKKINHQRASSVLAPKRPSSKLQSNKKKLKENKIIIKIKKRLVITYLKR